MMYGKPPKIKNAIKVLRERPMPDVSPGIADDEEIARKKKAALDAAAAQIPTEIKKRQKPAILRNKNPEM